MPDYDAIVIGAGCGGLSVGSQLAKQGRKTLVIEQSERIGGCCSTFESGGYHFDLGASVIEDANVINWAFERLGTTLWDEVDLIPCDPTYTVMLRDGTKMHYPIALEASEKEVARIAPGDVPGWRAYSKYMDGFLHAALDGFFVQPANNLADMVAMFAKTPALLKYGPLFVTSYQDVLEHYFADRRIRESLAFQSFFVGLPPELCPAYFAMIPYSEHEGLYYSKGGMVGIPEALQRCGEQLGMETRLKTQVKRVLVRNRRAIGVELMDGTEITAPLIVSDINARQLYEKLIGEEHLPWLTRVGLKSYEYSMATPMIYLGVDYTPPLDSHHTLVTLPVEELDDFWWNIYKKGKFPTDQFGIISWTSYSDPALAPEGHHVLVLTLAPGPYELEGTTWDAVKTELMTRSLLLIRSTAFPAWPSTSRPLPSRRRSISNASSFRPKARSTRCDRMSRTPPSSVPRRSRRRSRGFIWWGLQPTPVAVSRRRFARG